jgi:peptidoglycan/LPS O-acetylase OafA/YrhL
LVALSATWLLAAAIRTVLVLGGAVHPQIWCNTLAHLDPLACGAILAVLTRDRDRMPPRWLRAILICVGVGVVGVAGSFGDFVGPRSLVIYPLVSLGAGALILASLRPASAVPSSTNPLVYLGKISYGLYVFHLTFIELLRVGDAHSLGRRTGLILAALLATGVATALSYRVLERPFLAMKGRFTHIPSRPC